jgi:hypothetical protein
MTDVSSQLEEGSGDLFRFVCCLQQLGLALPYGKVKQYAARSVFCRTFTLLQTRFRRTSHGGIAVAFGVQLMPAPQCKFRCLKSSFK